MLPALTIYGSSHLYMASILSPISIRTSASALVGEHIEKPEMEMKRKQKLETENRIVNATS